MKTGVSRPLTSEYAKGEPKEEADPQRNPYISKRDVRVLIFCYNEPMKIHMGTDHAGFELKEKLRDYILLLGHQVIDHGAFANNPGDDYPDFIAPVAKAVAEDPESRGIILGSSGEGEQMVANRFPHVRATEFYGGATEIVRVSREHNNANILSLGARFLTLDVAKAAVKVFLDTPFSGESRHVRRIAEIDTKPYE